MRYIRPLIKKMFEHLPEHTRNRILKEVTLFTPHSIRLQVYVPKEAYVLAKHFGLMDEGASPYLTKLIEDDIESKLFRDKAALTLASVFGEPK